MPAITPDEISKLITEITQKEFRSRPMGAYDGPEVDEYLDTVCDRLQEIEDYLRELIEKYNNLLRVKPEAPAPAAAPVSAEEPVEAATKVVPTANVEEIIATAVQMKNRLISETQDKAEAILAEAKEQAETALSEAKQEAETILSDAKAKADVILAEAQSNASAAAVEAQTAEVTDLTERIAGLKQVAADYRSAFEALLQSQQEALDKADKLF